MNARLKLQKYELIRDRIPVQGNRMVHKKKKKTKHVFKF